MKLDSKTYNYSSKKSTNFILMFAGLALLSIAWFSGFDSKEFYFSYLTSFFFWLSIILGAMFFIFVHYAFSATWSVAIKRVMENTLMLMPIFTMLFFPIIAGMELLFKWLPAHSYWLTHSFEADHLIPVSYTHLRAHET